MSCPEGYVPMQAEIMCVAGQWTNVECKEQFFLAPPSTYYEAWKFCSSKAGHLATIRSELDNELATKLCHGLEEEGCFIGLKRADFSSFAWIDGTHATFESWDAFQPSNGRFPQHNVVILRQNGLWDDIDENDEIHPAICEKGTCVPHKLQALNTPTLTNIEIEACTTLPETPEIKFTDSCKILEAHFSEMRTEGRNSDNTQEFVLHRIWISKEMSDSPIITQKISTVDMPPRFNVGIETRITVHRDEKGMLELPQYEIKAYDTCDGAVVVQYSRN
eukprot:TRINITY_DN215_c0_g1_i1.p1 TRINITY_DN215_c0_g1~~TRINITY_DN215_c0_g1_i1.p1  ORF type:complete len:276 (-),score=65.20 TRINITY_DN215_c0_g1_i1:449-1276(-)